MTPSTQTSLAALPPEIRSIIFKHVFHSQCIRLRCFRSCRRGSIGNLSILATSRFFHRDPVVRDALCQSAVLVLQHEADWLKLVRHCFENDVFDGSKLIKRMVWKVPEEAVHTTRAFCQQVTQERVTTVLLSLNAFEVHLNNTYGRHAQCYGTKGADWTDKSSRIIYVALHSPSNRDNEQYEVIWSALQEVLVSDSQVVPTVRFPAFSDCTETNRHTHAWDEPMTIDAVMNLKDFRMRIDANGETYGLPQPAFSLFRPACKSCGSQSCPNIPVYGR